MDIWNLSSLNQVFKWSYRNRSIYVVFKSVEHLEPKFITELVWHVWQVRGYWNTLEYSGMWMHPLNRLFFFYLSMIKSLFTTCSCFLVSGFCSSHDWHLGIRTFQQLCSMLCSQQNFTFSQFLTASTHITSLNWYSTGEIMH